MKRTSGQRSGTRVADTGCCPRFDPYPWQNRKLTWDSKPFVRDRSHSVLHIPLDFGKAVERAIAAVGDALDPDQLVLCNEDSPWGTDIFVATTRPVAGCDIATISGTFLTSVFDGPYRKVPDFRKRAIAAADAQGMRADQVYFWYTTCPSCAQAYGENYIVVFVGQD
jgi:hypothetical protein